MITYRSIIVGIWNWSNRIHSISEDWYFNGPAGKERNCSVKAFVLAQKFGIRLNKMLGYKTERGSEFIEKDYLVYATSMVIYFGLFNLLVLVTDGNFKTND
jgi:hypothetical protein